MRGDPDFCDQCEYETGRPRQHEQTFRDSTTGRNYCTEHTLFLTGWLMDGQPEGLFDNCLPTPTPPWPAPKGHPDSNTGLSDDSDYAEADGSFSVRGGQIVPRNQRTAIDTVVTTGDGTVIHRTTYK